MTEHWHFSDTPDASQRDAIARTLLRGGVVLMPTDTIYGLHALASDADAVGRIASLKGRDDTKPFIVLASSPSQFARLGIVARAEVLDVLGELWPAPLTAILPIVAPLPASRGASTLAVRIPALEWLRELVERTGPLVSTSANRSGETTVRTPSDLAQELQPRLDGIADGGLREAQASMILDLTGERPVITRESDDSFTQFVRKTLRKLG